MVELVGGKNPVALQLLPVMAYIEQSLLITCQPFPVKKLFFSKVTKGMSITFATVKVGKTFKL